MNLDLSVAFHKLHQLQLDDGDLGAEYWLAVTKFLKDAETLCERAELAEAKLEQVRKILNPE